MCGIAGVVNDVPEEGVCGGITRMLAAQEHRGPEGRRVVRVGNAALGQCALAYTAIGRSPQPYVWADGRCAVVFNGEVYNYGALRAELENRGIPVGGAGEAPVLAALYSAYELGMAAMLNGMFAIAIYDSERRQTVLIRDRFGKKPLYYFVRGRRVAFASELRAVRRDPYAPSEIDGASLARFVTLNSVPAPHSLIRGISKVEPGCVVRIRDGAAQTTRYWEPRLAPRPWRTRECIEVVHRQLTDAVAQRLPDEVRAGVFLSGGLDSALITAIAARRTATPLPTFSAGFPDEPSYDETGSAVEIARFLGTAHTIVEITKERLAQAIPACLEAIDEPIADHSLIPTSILAREARKSVKAVLTGDGADELMTGYRIFSAAAVLRGARRVLGTRLLHRLLARIARGRVSYENLHHAHVAQLVDRMLGATPEHLYHVAAAAVPEAQWTSLLAPQWHAEVQSTRVFAGLDGLIELHGRDLSPTEALQLGMLCHFLRDTILGKLDRATMLASLEARSPFLDATLAETLLTVPVNLKLRFPFGKYILRRIARHYLPTRFIYQRKRGFRVPIASLLRGKLRDYAQDMLSRDAVRRAGLFRADAVQALTGEHFCGAADHHRALWSVLCAQAWALSPVSASQEHSTSIEEVVPS
jgi:asparagine synthase (glutamine-hydrolysing)